MVPNAVGDRWRFGANYIIGVVHLGDEHKNKNKYLCLSSRAVQRDDGSRLGREKPGRVRVGLRVDHVHRLAAYTRWTRW